MRNSITISILSLLAFQSCKTSPTDYATDWSNEVKQKILEDANQEPDKTIIDSTTNNVTLYKGNKKIKFYHLNPTLDSEGRVVSLDTALSIFYSSDQNFELIRELCPVADRRPVVDRSFEGIRYKGNHLGLVTLKYCDGKLKETGFRLNGNVGIWKEYDTNGNIVKETDHGNIDKLEELKKIKYY